MTNLTLKSTIVALTTIVAASSVSANTQTWSGNSGTVGADGCTFTNRTGNNTGQMSRSTVTGEENIWKTTRKGNITVHARGQSSVAVTSDNKLYTNAGVEVNNIVATFNYNGQTGNQASIIQKRGAAVATKTNTSLAVTNLAAVQGASQINFLMGGTVTMTTNGALNGQSALDGLNNNTVYKVIHTVTCTQ
tara:strand:+ start:117 stop:689 length:573 start_codon:yes stop_codon:yes gene_type:complete